MPRALKTILWVLTCCVLFADASWAMDVRSLETRFSTIRYSEPQEIHDFLWRLTGKHLELEDGTTLVQNRVDEIVEKVESLLEMYPAKFHFTIELSPQYERGAIAEYSNHSKTIRVAIDRVTDGVLAHEIAHAVICAYFSSPPAEKAQEILAQYVDTHLYNLS